MAIASPRAVEQHKAICQHDSKVLERVHAIVPIEDLEVLEVGVF
eukprot:CAMPEP_0181336992 /NCGR_PEP_ID=MMETSP1101-20121128/27748_1 /TAXON_ID=46948 /ORGANISM="Rhodomonas abbreviata, Strain Caron Lab Isolate" /LENGTH=43 /DNA_ID= /DNA_START= /DNA_END= /DNA_ORIENTATION=